MKGPRIIDAYHTRRMAPLMRRALPLHMMAPEVALDGTTLTEGAFSPSKVAQRIKEAMDPSKDNTDVVLEFVYPVLGNPLMRSEPGFIDFISSFPPCLLFP